MKIKNLKIKTLLATGAIILSTNTLLASSEISKNINVEPFKKMMQDKDIDYNASIDPRFKLAYPNSGENN